MKKIVMSFLMLCPIALHAQDAVSPAEVEAARKQALTTQMIPVLKPYADDVLGDLAGKKLFVVYDYEGKIRLAKKSPEYILITEQDVKATDLALVAVPEANQVTSAVDRYLWKQACPAGCSDLANIKKVTVDSDLVIDVFSAAAKQVLESRVQLKAQKLRNQYCHYSGACPEETMPEPGTKEYLFASPETTDQIRRNDEKPESYDCSHGDCDWEGRPVPGDVDWFGR